MKVAQSCRIKGAPSGEDLNQGELPTSPYMLRPMHMEHGRSVWPRSAIRMNSDINLDIGLRA